MVYGPTKRLLCADRWRRRTARPLLAFTTRGVCVCVCFSLRGGAGRFETFFKRDSSGQNGESEVTQGRIAQEVGVLVETVAHLIVCRCGCARFNRKCRKHVRILPASHPRIPFEIAFVCSVGSVRYQCSLIGIYPINVYFRSLWGRQCKVKLEVCC